MFLRSAALALVALASLHAQTSEEPAAIATAQKVFDGMAAHDAGAIRSVMLPDARFWWTREDGSVSSSSAEDFITRISNMKGKAVERFTSDPKVLVHGRTAHVWGEYDVSVDGKFGHCGVDSFSLLKTAEGWKIASIVYTAETTSCPGH